MADTSIVLGTFLISYKSPQKLLPSICWLAMNKKYDGGINMLTYSGEELEAYKRDCLEIQPDWNERNFVHGV